jgi:hypothetical protein
MGSLILISCNDKKREGGKTHPAGSDPIPWLAEPGLGQRLFLLLQVPQIPTLFKNERLSIRRVIRGKDIL